jgi:hypothetical protein
LRLAAPALQVEMEMQEAIRLLTVSFLLLVAPAMSLLLVL